MRQKFVFAKKNKFDPSHSWNPPKFTSVCLRPKILAEDFIRNKVFRHLN